MVREGGRGGIGNCSSSLLPDVPVVMKGPVVKVVVSWDGGADGVGGWASSLLRPLW